MKKRLLLVWLLCMIGPAFADCDLAWDAVTHLTTGIPVSADDITYRVYVALIGEPFELGGFATETIDTTIPCDTAGFAPGDKAMVTALWEPENKESQGSNVISLLLPPGEDLSAPLNLHIQPMLPDTPGRPPKYSDCQLVWTNPPEAHLASVALFIRTKNQTYDFLTPWVLLDPAFPSEAESVACDFPSFNTWFVVVRGLDADSHQSPSSNEVALTWVQEIRHAEGGR